MLRQQPFGGRLLGPEARGRHGEFTPRRKARPVCNREERHRTEAHAFEVGFSVEDAVEQQMPPFVRQEGERTAGKKLHSRCCRGSIRPSCQIGHRRLRAGVDRQKPQAKQERGSRAATADTALKLHFAELEEWRSRMLETIAIILIVLWLLGVVSGYTLGNFIYVLLVIAIVLFLVRLISGRRVV